MAMNRMPSQSTHKHATNTETMNISPLKQPLPRPSPLHGHGHTRPRHYFSSDSEDDDTTGADLIEKMNRRAQQRSQMMKHPMSSPVRRLNKESPIHSRTLGEKYTLRTRNYRPFHQRDRDARRDQEQSERRGGSQQMARFVHLQDEKADKQRMEKEAESIAPNLDEMSDISQDDDDPYQRELEEMLRQEEDAELDAMLAELTI